MEKNISKLCLDLLNEPQEKILFKLSPFFARKGILAGGTSLMLQLGHRKSFDLDLFFPYSIPKYFLRMLSDMFGSESIKVLVDNSDELTVNIYEENKVTFIYYPFARIYETINFKDLKVSSFKDIASDKAYVIGRRPQYRDYADLFFIIKNGFPLKKIIADARKKFKGEFSEKLFLSQLIYFEDIDDFTIDFIERNYTPEEVSRCLVRETERYKGERLKG